jgi:hypothetical protein
MPSPYLSNFIVETPIPKAKRSGIGKLNNPAKRRVEYPAACCGICFQSLFCGSIPVICCFPALFDKNFLINPISFKPLLEDEFSLFQFDAIAARPRDHRRAVRLAKIQPYYRTNGSNAAP